MSLSPEDKIIIWIISLGIAIGLILYIGGNVTGAIQPSPILVSVFIALGFSAAIYRFLGGLSGSGMSIGPAKLAGTAAAFLAITWFLNQSLEKQWVGKSTPVSMAELSISPKGWFALDKKSGEPVKVEVILGDSIVKTFPSRHPGFPNRNLLLEKPIDGASNFVFSIKVINEGDSLLLGGLDQSQLTKNKLFSSFADNNNNLFTSDFTRPGKQIDIAPELPFLIRTGEYSQNLTRFALVNRNTKAIEHRSSILLRGGKIFEVDNRLFLLLVTQVDHTRPEDQGGQYAKFGVIELNPT